MNETIIELALLFGISAVLGFISRLLKQPLMLAFLFTGVIIGAYGLTSITSNPLYQIFADLGIMLLLFMIGLEINIPSLRLVGVASVVIGLGQIVFTFVGGFLITMLLGFTPIVGVYLSLALTFSSTIIVVKLLSEKRDTHSLYGKISVGILLVQDFVAILILLVLAGVHAGTSINWLHAGETVIRGLVLFGLTLWLGRTVIPQFFNLFARSTELLFIASLAWLFAVVSGVEWLGFSKEIGGFLAGLALANSAEHFQISVRVKPLRDFFLLLFFVVLGTSMATSDFTGLGWPVIVLSLFVLIGNPLIVLILMGAMGYHRRTSFLTGVTVAQISEFSLVLIALGLRAGHVQASDVTLVTAVGVITIALSSYLILYADKLYLHFEHFLRAFERAKPKPDHHPNPVVSKPFIVIGAHRTGLNVLDHLQKSQVAVIDFDPDIVTALRKRGYTALYGDITDPDLEEAVDFQSAKYVISTSPDVENNLHFLESTIKPLRGRQRPLVIVRASTQDEARWLYDHGADYVFVPTLASGQHLGQLLSLKPRSVDFRKLRKSEHFASLISK